MARFDDLNESKYLKAGDLGPQQAALLTFDRVEKVNVAGKDQAPEYKAVAYFNEVAKPLVLNRTNIALIKAATGAEDTDQARGKKVVVYYDPGVMYMGKATGGLRVRAPQANYSAPPPPPQAPAGGSNSDIPF